MFHFFSENTIHESIYTFKRKLVLINTMHRFVSWNISDIPNVSGPKGIFECPIAITCFDYIFVLSIFVMLV